MDQIWSTSTEDFLGRLAKPEPGYHKFAAMWALGKKAKEADASGRWKVLDLVSKTMFDTNRDVYQRFQCCYVISEARDESWVPQLADVLLHDQSNVMRSVAAEALGYFKNCSAARDAMSQALKHEKDPKVIEALNRNLNQGEAKYTPEQIRNLSAKDFLDRMNRTEPGYHKYAAMWALTQKAKDSSPADRKELMTLVVAAMNNTARCDVGRWECCYVISDCGDEAYVPALVEVLNKDPAFIMRQVSAEALGKFTNCSAAREALLAARNKEQDERVLSVIIRILGQRAVK